MAEIEKSADITEILKRSKEIVGYQQPVVIDKDTLEIVDGKHRKNADPRWPEVYKEFKNPKERLLYRIHANIMRRTVSRKERAAQLLELASYLEEEGIPAEQISQKIVELVPSLSQKYVINLLPAKYKSKERRRAGIRSAELREKRLVLKTESPAKILEKPKSVTSKILTTLVEKPITPESLEILQEPVGSKTRHKTSSIPKILKCPRCNVEVKTLYCTKCFSELKVNEIAAALRRASE